MRKGFKYVLHLGSNLGDRKAYLSEALAKIDKKIGCILSASPIFETEAWGKTDQGPFLNQAVVGRTTLSPFSLIERCKTIELNLGRQKVEKWGERIIDIDIIFYDSFVLGTSDLTIPHPLLEKRRFVLTPLNYLVPDFIHPINGLTIAELVKKCQDHSNVAYYKSSAHATP
jgi:2-amino-4-hydroxy-6-hydroxymethyldihydropteridine diphosphokinase